jgi:hypothetical protein
MPLSSMVHYYRQAIVVVSSSDDLRVRWVDNSSRVEIVTAHYSERISRDHAPIQRY